MENNQNLEDATNMADALKQSLKRSVRTFVNVLPIIVAMLLLTSLVVTQLPKQISAGLFGNGDMVDSLLAGTIGSVAMGHPLVSYLLGGELLRSGVSLIAVTALLVSWVTVGIIQMPAEAIMFGARFTIFRNIVSFAAAMAIAFLVVYTLRIIGAV